MKYALVITGSLAGMAIAAPDLVLLGYVLLILPGLVLTIAPTLFVYLALTAVVRCLLPISMPMLRTATAGVIALLLGWGVMQPFRLGAMEAYLADEVPDVLPDRSLALHGHVRIERLNHCSEPECDYLVLAVLDATGVDSVTTVTAGDYRSRSERTTAAYALVSAESDPAVGLFPVEPGEIVRNYLPLSKIVASKSLLQSIRAVEASWALRLAGRERLRESKPVDAESADWLIRIETPSGSRTSTLRRLTILDADGTVRYRQSYRRQAIPASMFYFGFQANLSGGSASASFHVGREIVETGDLALRLEPALLEAIQFPVPRCDAEWVNLLRQQVVQTLDDPSSSAAHLELARRYMGLFYFNVDEQDHELLARIVADDRVRSIDEQMKTLFSRSKTPSSLRDAYLQRIGMEHTSPGLRHYLGECLANMSPGTFAEVGPAYVAIFSSPEVCAQAAPLIATLADRAPEQALPLLDRMLDQALTIPHWAERRALIEAIRAALIRLGPQASSAVPRIRELFLGSPSPIMMNARDADEWRFALARMGVAIHDLPCLPNQSPESIEGNLRQVADKLQRYEQSLGDQ